MKLLYGVDMPQHAFSLTLSLYKYIQHRTFDTDVALTVQCTAVALGYHNN